MKKILFAISLFFVITLTGCTEKPFVTDVEGYSYTETDTLVFDFDNGTESVELFRYTFDSELKVFVNEDSTIYNFKNINDYELASDEISKLIDTYKDTVMFRSRESKEFDDVIKLSTGATEDDYNLVKVAHEGDVFIEDAFIVTDNGVTVLISYTKFQVEGVDLLVPSYIQMFISTIHQEVSWNYLGEDNDYSEERMKLITYELYVVPLPMKTGASNSYDDLLQNGIEVDDFSRAVNDNTENIGTWVVCSAETTMECINPISTTLEIQIYEMTIDDVKLFYEVNFGGQFVDGDFTFFNLDNAFVIYDMEQVEVYDDAGEIIDVVNAKIRLY